jgi:homoserine kinase
MDGRLSAEQMLNLGAGLEGHGDNMAPALFGGLRVVVREGNGYRQVSAPVADALKAVLFIPDFEMPTSESRKLLPQTLSKEDAVHNIGRAAMLVAALGSGGHSTRRRRTGCTNRRARASFRG